MICHPGMGGGEAFIVTINDLVRNRIMEDIHKVFNKNDNFLVYRSSLK